MTRRNYAVSKPKHQGSAPHIGGPPLLSTDELEAEFYLAHRYGRNDRARRLAARLLTRGRPVYLDGVEMGGASR